MDRQRDVVCTTLGSRPGDNLADVLFTYLFAEVLHQIRRLAAAAGLLTRLPWCQDMRGSVTPVRADLASSTVDLHDVTWMDDLSLLTRFPDSASVLPGLSRLSGMLVDCCLERGLTPNLDKGKTEALAAVNGRSSRAVRAQWLSDGQPTIPCLSAHWPGARLRVVPVYKHLGGLIHHRGGLQAEVRARVGHAWTALRKHWSKIFGQAHIWLRDKFQLFQSLVLTCLFFGSGTWSDVHPGVIAPLDRCYHNMCRALLRRHFKGDVFHLTDDRVRAHVQAPSVAAWLHFGRLSYLASFVTLDVPEAWALVHAEGHWLGKVRSSLSWLHTSLFGPGAADAWVGCWADWRAMILERPKAWKLLLRKVLRRDLRRDMLDESWQQCRGLLFKCLHAAGASVQAMCDSSRCSEYFCGVCNKRFRSRQQWAVHAFKRHGIVKPTRTLAPGAQCPACLRQYPSHIAMCNHLGRSARCRIALVRAGFHHEAQPGLGSCRADRGQDFLGTVRQGYGPAQQGLSSAPLPGADTALDCASDALLRALCDALELQRPNRSFQEVLALYRSALQSACVDPSGVAATLEAFRAVFEVKSEDLPIHQECVHRRVIEWMQDFWSADWICDGAADGPAHTYAVFRRSRELLMALDFNMEPEPAGAFVPRGCMLVCARQQSGLLHDVADAAGHICTVGDDQTYEPWLDAAAALARAPEPVSFLFCLSGLVPVSEQRAFACEKDFARARRQQILFQDIGLVIAQLWRDALPFVALLPMWDASIVATLRRLPGVEHTVADSLALLYNVHEDTVPPVLFHFLELGAATAVS